MNCIPYGSEELTATRLKKDECNLASFWLGESTSSFSGISEVQPAAVLSPGLGSYISNVSFLTLQPPISQSASPSAHTLRPADSSEWLQLA